MCVYTINTLILMLIFLHYLYNYKDLTMSLLTDSYKQEVLDLYIVTKGYIGAGRRPNSPWIASIKSILVMDANTKEILSKDAVIQWEVSDDEVKDRSYINTLESEQIYLIKAHQELKHIDGGREFFYFKEVISDNVDIPLLTEALKEYQKDIIYKDDFFGDCKLDKELETFEINIDWKNEEAFLYIDVDVNDDKSWANLFVLGRKFIEEQDKWDKFFREESAEKLTELANEWNEDEDDKITEEEFAKRISMSSITLSNDGDSYTVYYNDDDIFSGHVIEIFGSLSEGISNIQIAG